MAHTSDQKVITYTFRSVNTNSVHIYIVNDKSSTQFKFGEPAHKAVRWVKKAREFIMHPILSLNYQICQIFNPSNFFSLQ